MRAQLEQGLRDLDVIGGAPFADLPPDRALEVLRSISSTTFFAEVRGQVITSLYDDHEVWDLLGYEGPSYEQGGYIDRGLRRPRLAASTRGSRSTTGAASELVNGEDARRSAPAQTTRFEHDDAESS